MTLATIGPLAATVLLFLGVFGMAAVVGSCLNMTAKDPDLEKQEQDKP